MVLPPSMQSSLPAGWLTFTGRVLNPLDRYKRFQIIHPPFLDFAWRKGSFIMLLPSNAKREPDLFSLDVRSFDDRPPFFDLGFLIRGERLWRLLLGRRQFLTHVDVALLDGRVDERCTHRAVELRDDVGGRTLGQPEAVPETHDQTGYAHFLKGRHLRRREPAGLSHHDIGLDLAVAHPRQGVPRKVAHEVDLTGDQVLHRRPAAAIWHELEFGAGRVL